MCYPYTKFYILDKIEELISDNNNNNNTEDKSTSSNRIENKNNNTNYLYYLALSMIVVSSGVLIYLYFNNDDTGMNDLLQGLSHLKNINDFNDNESLNDIELNELQYFVEAPKDIFKNIPVARTDSDSTIKF